MTKVGWDAIATWRDSRMGDRGDLWHRALIDPALLELLGSVRGQRVLDIGCGNGYLTRRLKRRGASRAVGVDASLASIRLARRRDSRHPSGAEFVRGNAARLGRFPNASFDRIVANMSLMDIRDAAGTVREMGRLLAPSGKVVVSISHPCFDIDERSSWVLERHPYHDSIARKIVDYRRERTVRLPWKISDTVSAYTDSYHRTLTTYSRYFHDAGLAILRMNEPFPRPEMIQRSDQGPFLVHVPLHLVIEAGHVRPGSDSPTSRSRGHRSRAGR